LWVQNVPTFSISKNVDFESFGDKYLTTNQTMISIEIRNMQIHQHKRTCRKKTSNQFVDFNIENNQ
jgi:hypothetical protein